MSDVHDAASKGYASGATAYVSGRPGYPPEVQGWLRQVVGLSRGKRVLDLGAGTGKFLPYLRETGANLIAVEPVASMLAKLVQQNPDVQALHGTATQIPLPDAAVNAVTCAQAFHWFATEQALAEIRRVLVPGGVLGLIWNGRDENVGWVAALSQITNRYQGDAPRYLSDVWRSVVPPEGMEVLNEIHFSHVHVGPPEEVIVNRTLSTSFIAALPTQAQAEVINQVRELIDATPELAGRSEVAFPYTTAAFAYRKVR